MTRALTKKRRAIPRRGANPAEVPRYFIPEVSLLVRVKATTLRGWVSPHGNLRPIIERPLASDPRLSYANLVEAYVVGALTGEGEIPVTRIRTAINRLVERRKIARPLLDNRLRVRRGHLLFEELGIYENLGRDGQLEIPEAIESYMSRVAIEAGLPVRLYPITRDKQPKGPRKIVIFPDVGFGRPVTEHRHISASVIYDRFKYGESVVSIAEDYELSLEDVEEALRVYQDGKAA